MDLLLSRQLRPKWECPAVASHQSKSCDTISARLSDRGNMLLKANASRAGVSCRQSRSAFASVRPARAPLAVRAQKQASAESQAFEVS